MDAIANNSTNGDVNINSNGGSNSGSNTEITNTFQFSQAN
jgi:hypothetical protein